MSQAEEKIKKAFEFHQAGKLIDAIALYEEVLLIDSSNAHVLFLIGTALAQAGRYKEAEVKLACCLNIDNRNPYAHLNLGNVQVELGLLNEAISSYSLSLNHDPGLIESRLSRGNILWRLKKLNEALCDFQAVMIIRPDHFPSYFNQAAIHWELNHPGQANVFYQYSIKICPDHADSYSRNGNVLWVLSQFEEALASYNNAIILSPGSSEYYSNRGNVLCGLRRLDEALNSYQVAIRLNPKNADAYLNRGNVLQDFGLRHKALQSYESAVILSPGHPKAYFNLANLQQDLNQPDQALVNYDNTLKINPEFEYCLGARQHAAMHVCHWSDFDSIVDGIEKNLTLGAKVSTPFPLVGVLDCPSLQRKSAELFCADQFAPASVSTPIDCNHKHQKRIKVGYYSSDFRNHATMHLMAEMFESHNRDRFDVYAFSFGPRTHDVWQRRAIDSFENYYDVGDLTDQAIAERSRQLGIDIAVDLKGFTQESRLGIFSRRAAPIQVNFLGYPGTLGADYIDYLIADRVLIPEGNQCFFSEKIAYLPGSYQPNCQKRSFSQKTIVRSDFDLPPESVVFCSFNANWKITPSHFSCWMNILKNVEGSVLWLLSTNPKAQQNLRMHAEKRGVSASRLIFSEKVPVEEHLIRMSLADMMLDTYPCGAHTTCSDALRMGLPLLTQMGRTFASRVAGSLLSAVGMPELIAMDQDEYQALAIRLGNNPEALSHLRNKLQSQVSASRLYDSVHFVSGLERLYEAMIEKYRRGEQPAHLSIG